MNIDKYIELLRFYLTEKISEINDTLKTNIDDEVNNILSSILSAIFAVFITSEAVTADGIWATIVKVVLVIAVWYILKFQIWDKHRSRKKMDDETETSDTKNLTPAQVKSKVDKFDHIACDGVLLSWDFLDKYSNKSPVRQSEKEFYLIEAFYYYKKALLITWEVVYYAECCVNNSNVNTGVAKYRLENIYNSLLAISTEIEAQPKSAEFSDELEQVAHYLKTIKDFLYPSA